MSASDEMKVEEAVERLLLPEQRMRTLNEHTGVRGPWKVTVLEADRDVVLAELSRLQHELREGVKAAGPFARVGYEVRSVPSPSEERALADWHNRNKETR